MRSLACPECAAPMQAFFAEAKDHGPLVELDRCVKCTRIWFDVKELERAAGKAFLPRLKGAAASHACPVCQQTMGTSLIRGEAPIEECGSCGGALLDKGDFEVIAGAALREVKPKGAPPRPKPLPSARVLEFSCERCKRRTPVAEMATVNGVALCRSCELKPQTYSDRTLSDELDRTITRLFDDLFG